MDVENLPLNRWAFYLINHRRHIILDIFYKHFYLLGKGWFGVSIAFLLYLSGDERLDKYLLALFFQGITVSLLKWTFRAKRPVVVLGNVFLMERLRLKSFPSGDTAMASVIALSLSEGAPPWLKFVLFLYSFLIGYGRIYMGAHFPTDVLTGWLIGMLAYLFSRWLLGLWF